MHPDDIAEVQGAVLDDFGEPVVVEHADTVGVLWTGQAVEMVTEDVEAPDSDLAYTAATTRLAFVADAGLPDLSIGTILRWRSKRWIVDSTPEDKANMVIVFVLPELAGVDWAAADWLAADWA